MFLYDSSKSDLPIYVTESRIFLSVRNVDLGQRYGHVKVACQKNTDCDSIPIFLRDLFHMLQ